MRALLTSPLGFLVGLSLGALGGGGSILAVPLLVYAAGEDPKEATTTSLVLVGVAALFGMLPHLRADRIRVGTGLVFGLTGIPGSLLGSALNRHVEEDLLLLGFAALVLIAAWRMVTACPTCTRVGEDQAVRDAGRRAGGIALATRRRIDIRTAVAVLVAGTAVGFLTGLFGVGGGFVIVPALALALKLPLPQAIGTSVLVIAVNAAVGLITRLATTTIDWATTVPFVVAAVVGVLTGGNLADRLDPRRSLRAFATLLVLVATYTGFDAAVRLV